MNFRKWLFKRTYFWRYFWRNEFNDKSAAAFPFWTRIYYLIRGFTSESRTVSGVGQSHPLSTYVNDIVWGHTMQFLAGNPNIFNDKEIFEKAAKEKSINTPPLLAVFSNQEMRIGGVVVDACTGVHQLLDDHGDLVFKMAVGHGGHGLHIVTKEAGKFLVGGAEVNIKQWLARLDKKYLIYNKLVNHSYAQNIYSRCLNTIRLLTLWDYEEDCPYVAAAVHRFGGGTRGPVDNVTKGGVLANIDLATGVLGEVCLPRYGKPLERTDCHDQTNALITRVQIPFWEDIKKACLHAAKEFQENPFIGWDIAVLEDGFTVVEANESSNISMHQAFLPMRLDPLFIPFLKHHNI